MEGSAFFAAAHRFSAAELVQAIKVISDNQATDINNLSGAVLTELIQSALQEIVEFIDKLIELLAVLPENSESLLAFMDRFKNLRMTVTQRRQFRELAASLINAGNIDVVSVFSTADYQDARALLSELRLAVEGNPPVLHC